MQEGSQKRVGGQGGGQELPEEEDWREAGSCSWALREADRHVIVLEKQPFQGKEAERARNEGRRSIEFAGVHSFNNYSPAPGTSQKSKPGTNSGG